MKHFLLTLTLALSSVLASAQTADSTRFSVTLANAVWNFSDYQNTKPNVSSNTYLVPQSWILGNGGSSSNVAAYVPFIYPYTGDNTSSYGYDGRLCLRIYHNASASRVAPFAVLPLISDVQGYQSLSLVFYGKGETSSTSAVYHNRLRIGYITSLSDTLKANFNSAVHHLQDITCPTAAYQQFSVSLSTVPAGARIVLYDDDATYNNSVLLDNIQFVQAGNTCPQALVANEQMTVCDTLLPYTWRTHSLTAAGNYADTLRSQNGCDSLIYTMALSVVHCEAPQPPTTPVYSDFVDFYVYYPDAIAFKWTVYFADPDGDYVVNNIIDSIAAYNSNFECDGYTAGFVNEFTITYDDVEYSGFNYDGGSSYWMYNLNDVSANLGCSSQPITNGDVILWEYKQDWSSWDCTAVADLDPDLLVNMGTINAPSTTSITTDNHSSNAKKIFRNGQIYIIRDNRTYTIQGLMIK